MNQRGFHGTVFIKEPRDYKKNRRTRRHLNLLCFSPSFQLSNQVQDFTQNSCMLDGTKLGRSWLIIRLFQICITTQEREIEFTLKVRRARDLMNLGESVRHVPVGVVILPFSFLLFHIKKRVLISSRKLSEMVISRFPPSHFHGNGAELLIALCFQYSAPRCFLSTAWGPRVPLLLLELRLQVPSLRSNLDAGHSVILDGWRLVKLWRRLTCRLSLEEDSLVIWHALMSCNVTN